MLGFVCAVRRTSVGARSWAHWRAHFVRSTFMGSCWRGVLFECMFLDARR